MVGPRIIYVIIKLNYYPLLFYLMVVSKHGAKTTRQCADNLHISDSLYEIKQQKLFFWQNKSFILALMYRNVEYL